MRFGHHEKPLRPEALDSIGKWKGADIRMIMINGDNKYTAETNSRNGGSLDKD